MSRKTALIILYLVLLFIVGAFVAQVILERAVTSEILVRTIIPLAQIAVEKVGPRAAMQNTTQDGLRPPKTPPKMALRPPKSQHKITVQDYKIYTRNRSSHRPSYRLSH